MTNSRAGSVVTHCFWFSNRGVEYVWRWWDEAAKQRWLKRNPTMICPGGAWRKAEPGHFLRGVLVPGTALYELAVWLSRKGLKGLDWRRLFAKSDEDSLLTDTPTAVLTLINLGAGSNPEKLWEDTVPLRFWALLARVLQNGGGPYPCTRRERFGWFVAAPDAESAAAWELALMVAHNQRVIKCCGVCGQVFCGKGKVCPACRKKTRRQPTDRDRFLNKLTQWVRRGKISQAERQEIKSILKNHGLEAAMRAAEKLESRGG